MAKEVFVQLIQSQKTVESFCIEILFITESKKNRVLRYSFQCWMKTMKSMMLNNCFS